MNPQIVLLTVVASLLLLSAGTKADEEQNFENNDVELTEATKRSTTTQTCRNCEGCDLLFGTGDLDMETFQFPAIAESPATNAAYQAKLKRTFQNFVNLCVGISHLTPPAGGRLVRAGVGIFTSVVGLSTGKREGLWTKIERRVEAKIEQYSTYRHFTDLENNGVWVQMRDTLRKCPENIDKDDLKFMLRHKLQMFPQNNDDTGFTPYWAVALNSWLLNVVATYLELIKNDKAKPTLQYPITDCSLHEELTVLREDFANALRSLQSKRWKSIRGHDYDGGGDYQKASLQFRDENTGELYPETFTKKDQKAHRIQSTKTKQFKVIKEQTIDMIKSIRERFNSVLEATQELREECSSYTEIPEIPASVMDVDYPSDCFGEPTSSGEGACLLPCDLYSDGDNWCPNERALSGKRKRRDILDTRVKRRAPPRPPRPGGGSIYDGVIGGASFGTRNYAWCTTETSPNKWRACDPDGFKMAQQSLIFTKDWGRDEPRKSKKNKNAKKAKKEEKKDE